MSWLAADLTLWKILGIAVLLLIVRSIVHLVKYGIKQVSKDIIFILVWRFLSGQHLHGKKMTDAGFFTYGTRSKRHEFDQTGWMNQWEHKPHSHRILWRFGCLLALIGLGYGLLADRAVTLRAAEALIVYGLTVTGFIIEAKVRLRVHNRHVVHPIVQSLAAQLRLSPHAVKRMLHIRPEDITDEGEVGYLELPPEITPGPDQQTSVERIIDAHLPVDVEVDWRLQQAPKLGVIRAGLRPPLEVTWDETLKAMEQAAYGEIVIGKDRFKNVFAASFIGLDDPHWAFSVQSKRGKSNFLGLVSVQVLHQDPMAQVIAVDPKEESLIDFLGSPHEGIGLKPLLPGVTMANDPTNPEAMWEAIAKARRLLDLRRYEYARDRTKRFPTCLVILDELNMFERITAETWRKMLAADNARPKEERENLPKVCPVWDDIYAILTTGRFVGVHIIAVAQDFQAHIIGGKGARNLFGLRGMGGFQPNQWKYFVGTTPVPVAQLGVGRWIMTQGEQQDWVQITRCDPDKAYAWASHGRALYEDETYVQHADTTVSSAALVAEGTDGHTPEIPAVRVIVGLREAAKYLGYDKPDSFRKARDRYMETHSGGLPGEFRQGRSPAWPVEALDEWASNRPRAGRNDSDD